MVNSYVVGISSGDAVMLVLEDSIRAAPSEEKRRRGKQWVTDER